MFANIIVDISHEKLDRPFGYIIPKELEDRVHIGTAVMIPFGRGNRLISGYVIEITNTPGFDVSKMKKIESVVENATSVEGELIKLAWWIKHLHHAKYREPLSLPWPNYQT